mgnify:CR=1 FL=1
MGYKEIRRFRDGSVMVEIDGVTSIVGGKTNEHLKKKNWPAVVAVKLQKQFPHMIVEYVDEELPGISITDANGKVSAFCNWNKTDAAEAIYDAALGIVGMTEQSAIKEDPEYFMTHYIKTNAHAK